MLQQREKRADYVENLLEPELPSLSPADRGLCQELVYGAARRERTATLEHVERLFPVLHERRGQLAHTLSGGEQQMVAIARGLMARPRLLMIDEPFLGLAPRIVQEIGGVIRRIHDEGVAVLFVEQNVELALTLAHRGYVLESGRLILHGPSAELLQSAEVKRVFLGDQSI